MRKVLHFALLTLFFVASADAAVRDGSAVSRQSSQTVQTTNQSPVARTATNTARATINKTQTTRTTSTTARDVADREVVTTRSAVSRGSTSSPAGRAATTPVTTSRSGTIAVGSRNIPVPKKTTVARAASDTVVAETKIGAEYEQCKTAYFTCMDQFCSLKNDTYRRCSCSDRVYDFDSTRDTLQEASDQLTSFTENLDVVGMTGAQAGAMRTASEGENALTSDGSASKALLQAIMNSIRGEDTNVGGKFSDLNSINLSFDTVNAFGMSDAGQVIASYNGKNLYNAIYSQCRNAVRADCNNASLQRAVTAYLMAIEQDCNTVQSSLTENQKKMKAAVREGNALLDLARVENRQNRNSDDLTTCLNNVEAAVLSEEVCGKNYHKCLDNGEFIDISTGKPIAGVVRFYELEKLLTFNEGANVSDQQLSKISTNRTFVQNFEKRVKKFAQPALDKCTENADLVWADYLDKAMVDIFYAQKAKVSEIKQGCFDFVSACYVNGDNALTAAMKELMGDSGIILQPDKITLNAAVCTEYVDSCNNMFDGDIVKEYVENRKDTDTLSACRAVAKQCFDKFGGSSYENFYYPSSGLFETGHALDWFTLCKGKDCNSYGSECAKQLSNIASCSSPEMMREAFGGLDLLEVENSNPIYGLIDNEGQPVERSVRPTGVATEIYNQIIDILNTQCNNLQGRFVELQFIKSKGTYDASNVCLSKFNRRTFVNGIANYGEYYNLQSLYGAGWDSDSASDGENMCPRDYELNVDTKSWGACLCWENGARRSRNGTSVKCVAELPYPSTGSGAATMVDGKDCPDEKFTPAKWNDTGIKWCTQLPKKISKKNQVCPGISGGLTADGNCLWYTESNPNYQMDVQKIPAGIQ